MSRSKQSSKEEVKQLEKEIARLISDLKRLGLRARTVVRKAYEQDDQRKVKAFLKKLKG